MSKGSCDLFQQTVSDNLIHHRSIVDVVSKLQEASARTNRAVAKAVTNCGCLSVSANKLPVSDQMSLDEYRKQAQSHLRGELCEQCREIVESEVGTSLFYLTALCEILGLELSEILEKEQRRITALGVFNLS